MRRLAMRWRRVLPSIMLILTLVGLAGAAWLSQHYSTRWYWGVSASATLSEASRELTDQLDGAITLTVALPTGHALRPHLRRLISSYQRHHEGFELRFIAPDSQSQRARELGLVQTGQTLIEYGDRAETIGSPTEARISAALERLLRRGDRFVAFMTGNGTGDLLSQSNYDFGALGKALERKGYRLQPLDLEATSNVPANASAVIVAAPEEPLGIRKQAALRAYLRGGGALLWLADPGGPGPQPILPAAVADTTLADPSASDRLGIDDDRFIVLNPPFEHPAANELDAPIVLVGAGYVTPQPADGWQHRTVLPRPSHLDGSDADALGISLQHRAWHARAMVVGDSDAWANTYLGNGDNLRFGLQTMDWLTDAERFIGTYVEAAPDQRLAIGSRGSVVVIVTLLVGIPFALLITAAWHWHRLRRG